MYKLYTDDGSYDIFDAMNHAPSAIYVESSLGLMQMNINTLYDILCERKRLCREDIRYSLDRATATEISRDSVCKYGRIIRIANHTNEVTA